MLHQKDQDAAAAAHLKQALAVNPGFAPAEQLLAQLAGDQFTPTEVAIEMPSPGSPVYSLSDGLPPSLPVQVANNQEPSLEEPSFPSTRRAPVYRMPPVDQQEDDPAPSPRRLPLVEQADEESLELPLNGPSGVSYPTTQTSHVADELRQPVGVIRLLGSEPLPAPTPDE
jgi:hypothetical protein